MPRHLMGPSYGQGLNQGPDLFNLLSQSNSWSSDDDDIIDYQSITPSRRKKSTQLQANHRYHNDRTRSKDASKSKGNNKSINSTSSHRRKKYEPKRARRSSQSPMRRSHGASSASTVARRTRNPNMRPERSYSSVEDSLSEKEMEKHVEEDEDFEEQDEQGEPMSSTVARSYAAEGEPASAPAAATKPKMTKRSPTTFPNDTTNKEVISPDYREWDSATPRQKNNKKREVVEPATSTTTSEIALTKSGDTNSSISSKNPFLMTRATKQGNTFESAEDKSIRSDANDRANEAAEDDDENRTSNLDRLTQKYSSISVEEGYSATNIVVKEEGHKATMRTQCSDLSQEVQLEDEPMDATRSSRDMVYKSRSVIRSTASGAMSEYDMSVRDEDERDEHYSQNDEADEESRGGVEHGEEVRESYEKAPSKRATSKKFSNDHHNRETERSRSVPDPSTKHNKKPNAEVPPRPPKTPISSSTKKIEQASLAKTPLSSTKNKERATLANTKLEGGGGEMPKKGGKQDDLQGDKSPTSKAAIAPPEGGANEKPLSITASTNRRKNVFGRRAPSNAGPKEHGQNNDGVALTSQTSKAPRKNNFWRSPRKNSLGQSNIVVSELQPTSMHPKDFKAACGAQQKTNKAIREKRKTRRNSSGNDSTKSDKSQAKEEQATEHDKTYLKNSSVPINDPSAETGELKKVADQNPKQSKTAASTTGRSMGRVSPRSNKHPKTKTLGLDDAKEILAGKCSIRIFDPCPKDVSGHSMVWRKGRSYLESKAREWGEPRQQLAGTSAVILQKWLEYAKQAIGDADFKRQGSESIASTTDDVYEKSESSAREKSSPVVDNDIDDRDRGKNDEDKDRVGDNGDDDDGDVGVDMDVDDGGGEDTQDVGIAIHDSGKVDHDGKIALDGISLLDENREAELDDLPLDTLSSYGEDIRSVSSLEALFNCGVCSAAFPDDASNHQMHHESDSLLGALGASLMNMRSQWRRKYSR
ncbi:hypothetical protein ACA910_016029 [Epithemia clementina (nom. ined.)]